MSDNTDNIPYDKGWAWACVLGCSLMNFFIVGGFKSFGILFVEFREMFDESASKAAIAAAVIGIVNCLLAPVATALGKRFSYRIIVIIGGLSMGCGCVFSCMARSLDHIIVVYGILTGLGQAFCYGPSFVVVGSYFKKHRALANGISVAGSSFGTFILPPLIRHLLDQYTFRGAFLILGGLLFHLCVCGALYRPVSFYTRFRRTTTGDGKLLMSETVEAELSDISGNEAKNEPLSNYKRQVSKSLDEIHDNSVKAGEADVNRSHKSLVEYRKSVISVASEQSEAVTWDTKMTSTGSLQFIPHPKKRDPIYIGRQHKQYEDRTALLKNTGGATEPSKTLNGVQSNQPAKRTGSLASFFKEIINAFDFSLFHHPLFLIFMGLAFCGNFGYVNSIIIIPPYAKELGVSKKNSSVLLSILGVGDLCGRLMCGIIFNFKRVTAVVKRSRVFMVFIFLLGINNLIFPMFKSHTCLIVFCLVNGLLGGCYFSLFPTVLMDFVGVPRLSGAFGFTSMMFGLSVTVGPPMMGAIKDGTGTFMWAYLLCGIMLVLAGSLLVLEPWARRREVKKEEAKVIQVS